MEPENRRTGLGRRRLLAGLGGVGATALGARLASGPAAGARAAAQAEATPAATWTPPPIPQPLPEPGGTPPPLVGAEPPRPEAPPSSGAATSIENPQAAGTPGVGTPDASPVSGEFPVTNPQQPAQEIATPVAGPEATPTPATTVTLTPDFRFEPAEVTVRVGEAVGWENVGRSPQTVTCDPARVRDKSLVSLPAGAQPWDSGVLNFGETFVQVFDVAGEYTYVSMPQEDAGMTGRVIVQG